MVDREVLERITARRAELDGLHGWKVEEFLALTERRARDSGIRPHLLSLQELQEGQAAVVAERLGLAYVEEPNVRPGSRNAIFYDPTVFRPDGEWVPYVEGIRHRPSMVRLYLIDLATGASSRGKLSVASVHANFGNPHARGDQLRWLLSNMVKDGRLGFLQGDWNSWPVWGCPRTLDNVLDRAYALDRWPPPRATSTTASTVVLRAAPSSRDGISLPSRSTCTVVRKVPEADLSPRRAIVVPQAVSGRMPCRRPRSRAPAGHQSARRSVGVRRGRRTGDRGRWCRCRRGRRCRGRR
ncbi:hypothetical protein [Kitasatospora aureofaciens]|uniref:hypothetical protein n=1 Tax=Kitasatospora aureofaciens TaxID=1894 RepID=UPI00381D2EEB